MASTELTRKPAIKTSRSGDGRGRRHPARPTPQQCTITINQEAALTTIEGAGSRAFASLPLLMLLSPLDAAQKVADLVLARRLLWHLRNGTLIVPAWGGRPDRIHYPIQFYDVLFALQVLPGQPSTPSIPWRSHCRLRERTLTRYWITARCCTETTT